MRVQKSHLRRAVGGEIWVSGGFNRESPAAPVIFPQLLAVSPAPELRKGGRGGWVLTAHLVCFSQRVNTFSWLSQRGFFFICVFVKVFRSAVRFCFSFSFTLVPGPDLLFYCLFYF